MRHKKNKNSGKKKSNLSKKRANKARSTSTMKAPVNSNTEYPANQQPVVMPAVDKKVVDGVEKLIELSYIGYMNELRQADKKDTHANIKHLNDILSEYVGPYILVGYMPDNEPIEIVCAPTFKDQEALLERLRKTFVRQMNANGREY